MTGFILRRILQFPLVLLFLISISFFLMRLAPGGPFSQEKQLPPEIQRNIDRRYGFQRPMLFNFNYFSDLTEPVKEHLTVLADTKASDEDRTRARSALSGYDTAAISTLADVVLNGPEEIRTPAAATIVDIATWEIEEDLKESLSAMADDEDSAEERAEAREAVLTIGRSNPGVLAELLFSGSGGFQSQAADVLGDIVGFRCEVPVSGKATARRRAVRKWKRWWRKNGGPFSLPAVIPAASDGKKREAADTAWKKWWEDHREQYTFSFPGKVVRIADSQFLRYILDLLQFKFGPSFKYKDKTVNDIISEHLPHSILLGATAIVFALIMGLTAGVISGIRQNSLFDYASMSVAMVGLSVPMFVVGPMLVLVFALYLDWFNAAAWDSFPKDLLLPAFTLALPFTARIARLTRAGMLEVINQDYIRVARSKGLTERVVIVRHALKGALLPVVSFLGPGLAMVLTGSLVVEEIFGVPGIGKQFVKSALNRDYFVALGVVIMFGSLLIFFNLVVDILYGFLDPRIRYN